MRKGNFKDLRKGSILFLGVAYKPDVADCRESPTLRLLDMLSRRVDSERGELGIFQMSMAFHDPHVDSFTATRNSFGYLESGVYKSEGDLVAAIEAANHVVVCVNHSEYASYRDVLLQHPSVFDFCGMFAGDVCVTGL